MQPKHPKNFLVPLSKDVNDPTTWVLRPGTADNSILKLAVDSRSPACVRQAEYAMLARVCPGASNVATVGRQLGYWMFQKPKTGKAHLLDVEVEPGLTLTVKYHEYYHVPPLSEIETMWSNARGFPHNKHRRRTNNGMGTSTGVYREPDKINTKRAATPLAVTPSPKKLRTVEDLLQDDDLVVTNTGVYHEPDKINTKRAATPADVTPSPKKLRTIEDLLQDDDLVVELIKQFECADDTDKDDADILEAAKLDLDWTTIQTLLY